MHILTVESLALKTDEQGILITGGRGSKMNSETKVDFEKKTTTKNNIKSE